MKLSIVKVGMTLPFDDRTPGGYPQLHIHVASPLFKTESKVYNNNQFKVVKVLPVVKSDPPLTTNNFILNFILPIQNNIYNTV